MYRSILLFLYVIIYFNNRAKNLIHYLIITCDFSAKFQFPHSGRIVLKIYNKTHILSSFIIDINLLLTLNCKATTQNIHKLKFFALL